MSLTDDRCSSLSIKVLIDAPIESVHPRMHITYCNLLWDVKLERPRRAALLGLFERYDRKCTSVAGAMSVS